MWSEKKLEKTKNIQAVFTVLRIERSKTETGFSSFVSGSLMFFFYILCRHYETKITQHKVHSTLLFYFCSSILFSFVFIDGRQRNESKYDDENALVADNM